MRAFGVPELGAAAALADLPVPRPAAGEVQVRVHASSVNGWDQAVATGALAGLMEHRYPAVLGKDFAGTVSALGEGVTDFQVGDEVFGVDDKAFAGGGGWAEYCTVSARALAPRPAGLPVSMAAGLAWAGLTALQNVAALDPQAGDTVLILGASGGIGGLATQLVAARGGTVIATGQPVDEARLRDLGAHDLVDYTQDVAAQVLASYPGGVRTLLSLVPPADETPAITALVQDGGRIAATMGGVDAAQLSGRGVTLSEAWTQADGHQLSDLAGLFTRGQLRVPVQRTFALEEGAAALDTFTQGSHGKIIITVE